MPIVPVVPTPIPPACIAPATISPARMPVTPSPARMPIVPVPPPHCLGLMDGGIAFVNFRARTLVELLLNLLNTNLQRFRAIRLGRIGMDGHSIHGASRAEDQAASHCKK